jgi:simple sugar transport system permease protein
MMAKTTDSAHSQKEPLIRIARADSMPLWKSWLIHILFFLVAFAVYLLIIYLFTGALPGAVIQSMISGAFGSSLFSRSMWTTVRDTMLLLGVALALTLAFKMRFWNIGGEGQILIGGLATAIVMLFATGHMPTWALFLTMIVASLVAGAIWGIIPAVFKAKWNTNETLFTLMMNYIAIQLISFCNILWEKKAGAGSIGTINGDVNSANYQVGWFSTSLGKGVFGDGNYVIVFLAILLIAILVNIYMKRTKQGYELTVVGESENTARYAGINVKKVIIRTMMLSGMLCGFIGFLIVSGSSHTISTNTASNRGFTAIIVSWLGKFNVWYMALISFILVLFEVAAEGVATNFGLSEAMSDVLVGIVLFFILSSDFFVNYKIKFRGHEKEAKN